MAQKLLLPNVIGHTPLLYLRAVSELTGCNIYGKAEFMNPGGSVKDRTALGIIRAAEAAGELQPGGVIVEGTAGNTGIGLTLVANALGYECVIVAPQNASQEKVQQLEMRGAELLLVPSVPYSDSHHYIHTAERVATGRAKEDFSKVKRQVIISVSWDWNVVGYTACSRIKALGLVDQI